MWKVGDGKEGKSRETTRVFVPASSPSPVAIIAVEAAADVLTESVSLVLIGSSDLDIAWAGRIDEWAEEVGVSQCAFYCWRHASVHS